MDLTTGLNERLDELARRGVPTGTSSAELSRDWFRLHRDIRRAWRNHAPGTDEYEAAKALEGRLVEIVSPPTRGRKPPNDSQEN